MTVSQHQVSTFTTPVNGTSPIDANQVRGNDNSIKTAYNAHDADATIHLQNGLVGSRPSAGTAGTMWLASDVGAGYLWLDNGSAWVEASYLRATGGTITGNVSITGTFGVTGVATLTAQPILSSLTASQAVFSDASKGLVSNAITGTGNVVMSASPTLTGTITMAAATASGAITANAGIVVAASQAITGTVASSTISGFLSIAATTGTFTNVAGTLTTAAQTNITSVGTIGAGTWQGAVVIGTYGGNGVNNGTTTFTRGGNVTFSGAFATTITVTAGTSVTLPTSGTLVNTAVTSLTSLASVGGAFAISGALSGATTITASGLITSTVGNNLRIFQTGSATTGYQLIDILNTSGRMFLGIEGTPGGSIIPGSSAYSTVLGSQTNQALEFGTNNVRRGGFSAAGTFDVGGNFTVTGGGAVSGITSLRVTGNVGIGQAASATSPLSIVGLPTSSAGLATGDLYTTAGALMVK